MTGDVKVVVDLRGIIVMRKFKMSYSTINWSGGKMQPRKFIDVKAESPVKAIGEVLKATKGHAINIRIVEEEDA